MKFRTSNHIFAHIDCDSFFASCEILRNPKLKGKYVCVGEEIIVAATYNAKKLGIKIGTPIWEAKKILKGKDVYFAGHHMNFYSEVSEKLMKYLYKNTLDVRVFSIDEAFVEISGLPEMWGLHLYDYARMIQEDILQKVGVPVSIGISNTRLKAKIFSKVNKPFGVCIGIDREVEKNIFQSLTLRETPFIGKGFGKRLQYTCQTIYDYKLMNYFEVKRILGKNGTRLWFELNGVSSMGFEKKSIAKSIGRTRAFNTHKSSDEKFLLSQIQSNLDRMFEELTRKKYEIRNISLMLITDSWEKYTLEHVFQEYVYDRSRILEVLQDLFFRMYSKNILYRKTGIFSSDIRSFTQKQLSLFEKTNSHFFQQVGVEKILSILQSKYGDDIIHIGI